MIRQQLISMLKKAISESGFKLPEIIMEHPAKTDYGDYATNAVLQIAKTTGMRTKEIAETLKSKIKYQKSKILEKIEIVEPGFLNFFISKEYLQNQVGEILKQKQKFGQLGVGRKKKVQVEFISANPTGPLHIGNGRNAFAGDVLANVLQGAGYKVTREYFVNDAKNSKQIIELGKTALGRGTTYLTEKLKTQILKLKTTTQISKLSEEEAGYLLAQIIYQETRDFIEKKLKIKFDKWVSEEEDIYRKNKIGKTLDWLKKNKLVYEKDKALWLKTSQFGDERDWVIVRETGEPSYLLSDIAYHKYKFEQGFDKVIDIWGADHQAHVSKIKTAAKMLNFRGILDILILQLVTLKGKEKISKRSGQVIALEDLVDEIGLDVSRFFYLQKSLDTHMEMDLVLAKERSEKNPVFYVQYANARICSILRKNKFNQRNNSTMVELLRHASELNLVKQLIRLPEVIEDTANDYQLQRLPQYAMDLATAFHQFYRDCKVLSENSSLTKARLALVLATQIVLKNTLSLMGISAPEKM